MGLIQKFKDWLNTPPMREFWEKDEHHQYCTDEEAMKIFKEEQEHR